MKKVRFETPVRCFMRPMEDSECHSPRPFIEKQDTCRPNLQYDYPRPLLYNPDPVQRYECSNSSPYPVVKKTSLQKVGVPGSRWPSNDLELSMLDSSHHEPRNPVLYKKHHLPSNPSERRFNGACSKNLQITQDLPKPLTPIENFNIVRPENTTKDSNFFIKRDNLNKLYSDNALYTELNRLSLDKENNPLVEKATIMRTVGRNMNVPINFGHEQVQETPFPNECHCHHCVKIIENAHCTSLKHMTNTSCNLPKIADNLPEIRQHHACMQACPNTHQCHNPMPVQPLPVQPPEQCKCNHNKVIEKPTNLVDKKTWMVEKYQENLKHDLEIEKPNAVTKEKREPTVSDLFKIIKLQNEQLQLLQEKVDNFISTNSSRGGTTPIQNYMTEQIALQTVDKEHHKISIGVMTSFEMVRTSTVINKEIVTQSNDNAQIQCNRSQISIKEVVSKPLTLNFLDGIMPARKTPANPIDTRECIGNGNNDCDTVQHAEYMNDDKTLNELSLYNVQVDNATTPQISPEQSLYLDVRDYSDSESGSDDQSNVGWTYYNKVMTHVNGVLQDSEMPSSASALYRNTRQQCLQMQIDKTNVSVTKRVKFGDDPLGLHQPHIYAATTDTSLKMNQLAAKYLKGANVGPLTPLHINVEKPVTMPIEMSFATRNYMERHRILQGASTAHARSPLTGEMPRFLDITALKQQPKLL